MKIKQAEELVGITSKNIRFYEDQGLLQPKRSDNGYREYSKEDIEILWQGDIEHACSFHERAQKNHYLMEQISDFMKQLYEYYCLKIYQHD